MKIKKILILLFLIIMISGCQVNYNLTITSNSFNESSDIIPEDYDIYQNTNLNDFLKSFTNNKISPFYNDIDEINEVSSSDINPTHSYSFNNLDRGINIKYNYNQNDIVLSKMIKECFNEVNIQDNNQYIRINTSNECKAFKRYSLLNNINIYIKTDLKVIYSNADSVNGNTYIWNIDKNNYNSKNISLTLYNDNKGIGDNKKEEIEEKKEEKKEFKLNIILVIVAIIMVGLLFLLVFFVQKGEKDKY